MADVVKNMKDKAQEFGNTFASTASNVAEECQNATSYVADQAKAATNYVADQAKSTANQVASQASKAGEYVGARAGDAASSLGSGFRAAGDYVRSNAPHEGSMGQASTAFADTLSQTGDYLQQEGLTGIGRDLTNLVKRNPIPALLLGIGMGFLLARATERK